MRNRETSEGIRWCCEETRSLLAIEFIGKRGLGNKDIIILSKLGCYCNSFLTHEGSQFQLHPNNYLFFFYLGVRVKTASLAS